MTVTGFTTFQSNCLATPRVAWLIPTAWFCWQPALSKFTQKFSQTTVFTGLWPGFAKGLEDSLNVEVVGERKVISLSKGSNGYGSTFTALSLGIVNKLLKFKPHLIFSSSFGIWTILALLLKPLGKWRVVIAYEGSSPSVDHRGSIVRLLVRRAMVWAADACITNSQAGKAYLTEVLNAKQDCVFVQPYQIPPAQSLLLNCTTSVSNPQPQRPVFLFVGSVIPRKGLHLLLQACTILQRQGYRDYTLLVVGDGPQREELETFCQENNLSESVQWLGRVDYDRINAHFQAADVFILPTLEDTLGLVVLEAMIFGKPILCSKYAGVVEMVVDGENGYHFDPHEPEQLAEVMRCMIEQPALLVSMGKRSQQLVAQYNPEAAAEFLSEVTSFVMKSSVHQEVAA